jgi:transposase
MKAEKEGSLKTRLQLAIITHEYLPSLTTGECPRCGLMMTIPDFCKKLECILCGAQIEV